MNDEPIGPDGHDKDTFDIVGRMEQPLATVRDLVVALARIAETLDDDEALPIQRLAWIALDHCNAVEEMRGELFHLSHPNRDKFKEEGWPPQEHREDRLS